MTPTNIYLFTNQLNFYKGNYKFITITEGINILKDKPELGLDTETSGLDPHLKDLLLLQLGDKDHQVLFDIGSCGGKIPHKLIEFMNSYKGIYILQNAKFDLKFLFAQQVYLYKVFDTMLAETILTNGLQYSGRDLATLVDKYCNEYMDKSARGEIILKGLTDNSIVYGARDIIHLGDIKRKQLNSIRELGLETALDLDNSFVVVLAYVEFFGIKLDYSKWEKRVKKYIGIAVNLKEKLEDIIYQDGKLSFFSPMVDMFTNKRTCELNWDSPKQVISLFKSYGINVVVKEKGNEKESIDSKVLDPQKDSFPILPIYLEYKATQKIISTYGYNWKNYINKKTGRIHSIFKQLMDTGRLSCGSKFDNAPNLQNIPADEETRSCFVPEKGNVLLDADYSAQEQIVLANASKEKNLLNFYEKGFSDMKACPSI